MKMFESSKRDEAVDGSYFTETLDSKRLTVILPHSQGFQSRALTRGRRPLMTHISTMIPDSAWGSVLGVVLSRRLYNY